MELAHPTVKGSLQAKNGSAPATALELSVDRGLLSVSQAHRRDKGRPKAPALAASGHHPPSSGKARGNQARRGPPSPSANWPEAVLPISAQNSKAPPGPLVAVTLGANKRARRAHLAPFQVRPRTAAEPARRSGRSANPTILVSTMLPRRKVRVGAIQGLSIQIVSVALPRIAVKSSPGAIAPGPTSAH